MDNYVPTPEELEMLAELGVSEDKLEALRAQMAETSYDKAARPRPEGNTAGGIYIASNPLQHAAYAMGNIRDDMRMQDMQNRESGAMDEAGASRQKAMAMFLRSRGGAGGGQPQGMGDGMMGGGGGALRWWDQMRAGRGQ